jgi:hypothetical protein
LEGASAALDAINPLTPAPIGGATQPGVGDEMLY